MKLPDHVLIEALECAAYTIKWGHADATERSMARSLAEYYHQKKVAEAKRARAKERARIKAEARRVLDPVTRFYVDVP